MTKIGLVSEGGGMKCAYGAGVLDAMMDNNILFNYCIGVSAGSANLASYMAGQKGRNIHFYVNHVKDPNYFGIRPFLKTGNLFNLQYIYGDLSNDGGVDEIHFDKIMDNPAEYELVATNALTGKPKYFSKHEMIRNDLRHVMASSAIPVVSRPIYIGGIPYFDGGVSDAIPVKRAMEQGCDKIVCILSKSRNYVKRPQGGKLIYSLVCRKYPAIVKAMTDRHIMYKECQDYMYELERQGKAFIFSLETDLKISTYAMDPVLNKKLYDIGVADFKKKRDALIEFMN